MDPTNFAAKTVNFDLFFDIPFFRFGVDVASYGPNQIGMHFSAGELVHFTSFLFQVTYCSSRWFAKLGPFPAATIDFSHLFSDLPRKRSPQ